VLQHVPLSRFCAEVGVAVSVSVGFAVEESVGAPAGPVVSVEAARLDCVRSLLLSVRVHRIARVHARTCCLSVCLGAHISLSLSPSWPDCVDFTVLISW
jgi:hypothetical protein